MKLLFNNLTDSTSGLAGQALKLQKCVKTSQVSCTDQTFLHTISWSILLVTMKEKYRNSRRISFHATTYNKTMTVLHCLGVVLRLNVKNLPNSILLQCY